MVKVKSSFEDKAKVPTTEEVKAELAGATDSQVALLVFDLSFRNFNNANFSHFNFALNILALTIKFRDDGILDKERAKVITKLAGKLYDESIVNIVASAEARAVKEYIK